jgi:excinuclease UvrABC nuclease subunit
MRARGKELDFEHAVELRDRIKALRQLLVLETG